MVLAIDIGNSNITLGGFLGDKLSFTARMATDNSATEDDYACRILNLFSFRRVESSAFSGTIIASVVPQLNATLGKAVKAVTGIEPIFVGPGIKTGISIRCDSPASVGADLICTSVAAYYVYGGPALVIDMGTATKMTVVNGQGAFIGASITCGIMMGLSALSSQTAQLPRISLDAPGCVIAKNTVECMKSGAIFAHASMIDGMVEKIKDESKENLAVYITGGYAPLVFPYCKSEMTMDEHLALKGLNIIYRKNT